MNLTDVDFLDCMDRLNTYIREYTRLVHYITKLEDFQELMPYEVYKGMSSFLQSQLNTMEEEYEDSLSAVRSDLNLLDEKYDELEAEKDNLEVKLVEALEQLEEYKDQFGEL